MMSLGVKLTGCISSTVVERSSGIIPLGNWPDPWRDHVHRQMEVMTNLDVDHSAGFIFWSMSWTRLFSHTGSLLHEMMSRVPS